MLAPAEALAPAYESERVVGVCRRAGIPVPSKEARDATCAPNAWWCCTTRARCCCDWHGSADAALRAGFAPLMTSPKCSSADRMPYRRRAGRRYGIDNRKSGQSHVTTARTYKCLASLNGRFSIEMVIAMA